MDLKPDIGLNDPLVHYHPDPLPFPFWSPLNKMAAILADGSFERILLN